MPGPEAARAPIAWERYPWAGREVRRKFSSLVARPSAADVKRLTRGGPASVFEPGCVLFYRDHRPLGSFLILEGSVMFDLGRGGRPGRGVTVEAPVLLGGWHARHGAPYPATARAATRTAVVLVPREEAVRGAASAALEPVPAGR